MIKYFYVTLLAILIICGCSGRSPEPSWEAEEYYEYARELYDNENYYESANEFTIIILRYAGSSIADSAQFYLGMSHYQLEEYIISAAEFSKLINNMPQSPLVPEAQYMLGMSYYQMSPRAALDQEYTKKSLKAFQVFIEDFPRNSRREDVEIKLMELREKLAQKEFLNADLYRKMYQLQSSLIYYDIVLERYYDTSWADDALLGKVLVYMELEEWQNARKNLLIFKDKFPNSDFNNTVDRNLEEVTTKIDNENDQ